jgi:hypothetical protein
LVLHAIDESAICIASDLVWFEVCPRFVADSPLEGAVIGEPVSERAKIPC